MPCKPSQWEVWYANVKFEDEPNIIKPRPVVITNTGEAFLIALYVTSTPERAFYPYDYTLIHWEEAGLEHQSTVRLDRKLRLKQSDLVKKLGRLNQNDILLIQFKMPV